MLGNFACFLSSVVVFCFFKINFFEKFFLEFLQNVSLNPELARQNVGPDLGPNCLQKLSADDTSRKIAN